MEKLEALMGTLFTQKLPVLPDKVKSVIMQVLPWIFAAFGALGFLSWITAVGLVNFSQMAALKGSYILGYDVPLLGLIIFYALVPLSQILIMAGGYYMLGRRLKGWRLAVLATLISLTINALYVYAFGVVWDVLVLYALQQIKELYPKTGV
ncbi:hypothetical protein [Acetonema longum]|uniref:Uncharacterized protein n=1 Tax=Acetonema longum DSM 6540 TaxID=1009370 RepID=F7NGP7_9FIRM|nr:hypothetical protein [Acetonema longum]EGO64851.1 hypothetical protein ALO_06175 [Acetonema longum DSM 6540]